MIKLAYCNKALTAYFDAGYASGEYKAALDGLRTSNDGLGIGDFLIMPVQRLPRYELLVREAVKCDPDNTDLKQIHANCVHYSERANAVQSHDEIMAGVDRIRELAMKTSVPERNQAFLDLADKLEADMPNVGKARLAMVIADPASPINQGHFKTKAVSFILGRDESTAAHKELVGIASNNFKLYSVIQQDQKSKQADDMIRNGITSQFQKVAMIISARVMNKDSIIFPFISDEQDKRVRELRHLERAVNSKDEPDPREILLRLNKLMKHLKRDYKKLKDQYNAAGPDNDELKKQCKKDMEKYKDLYNSLRAVRKELSQFIELSQENESRKHPGHVIAVNEETPQRHQHNAPGMKR